MTWSDQEARERVDRLEGLLAGLETLAEPARATALDAVGGLVEVYGEALGRIVAGAARGVAAELACDELVGHLLMVHDLHPASLEERVLGALEEVRPYLESHGGGVALAGVEGGTVRLRLEGHCNGCPSSTATLRLAVEDAIRDAAPEVEHIEADGAVEEAPTTAPAGFSLPMASSDPGNGSLPMAPSRPHGVWSVVGALPELASEDTLVRDVSGEEILFARLNGGVYAYRSGCPGCGESLSDAALEGAELACTGCGLRYDVAAAGRCAEDPELHLDPLPLLVAADGAIKIAHRETVAR